MAMDPMSVYLLARLRQDELMREAAADWRADEASMAGRPLRGPSGTPRWPQAVRALAASIIDHLRVGPPLESTRG